MKINKHNYESFLLDYIDDELTKAEADLLLKYLRQHPELQEELQVLQKTKLKTEEICFPDKTILYRSESKKKKGAVIPWARLGVAAAVAACLLAIIIFSFNREKRADPGPNVAVLKKGRPAVLPAKPEERVPYEDPKKAPVDSVKSQQTLPASTIPHIASRISLPGSNSSPPVSVAKLQEKNKKKSYSAIDKIPVHPLHPEETLAINAKLGKIQSREAVLSPQATINDKSIAASGELTPKNITSPLQQIRDNKESFDSTVTDKVFALHEKMRHPLKALNIKKVRIGNFSLVFN